MINFDKTLDKIIDKSGAAKQLNPDEIPNIRTALAFDLNQYILDTIISLLSDAELSRIEKLLKENDEAGINEILAELKENKETEKALDKAVKDYQNNIINDLKKIKKLQNEARKKD